jgi:hypothetical protein
MPLPTDPKIRVDPKVRALRAIADRLTSKLPSGEGHAAWHQVHAHVVRLADASEALFNLRLTRNPSETDAAHTKRVCLAADRFNKDITVTLNHIIKVSGDGHASIDGRINAKTKLNPDSYAGEVRAVYRGLASQTEKTKLIGEFIEQNRAAELAAIIKAPTSLTGMIEEHRQRYEAAFIAKHASEELAEKAALEDAFSDAMVSTRTAGELADAYADPVKLAAIVKAEAVAAEAVKAFDAKVSRA